MTRRKQNPPSPKHLFIIYFDLGIGGVQRKITDIVNYLQTDPVYKNTRISILLEDRTKHTLTSALRNPNATLYYKPFSRMPFPVFIYYMTVLLRPSSILSFLVLPALHTDTALRYIPSGMRPLHVICQDVVTSDAYRREDFGNRANLRISHVFNAAHAVIVPAPAIAADLSDIYKIDKEHIHHIPNWTTISPKPDALQPWTDCIYIGRLDKEKRVSLLLKYIAAVKKQMPAISLLIVGDGKRRQHIQKTIQTENLSDNVTLTPPTPNVSRLLSMTKIAVSTSESEGAPMFFLEAMAHRLPIVAMEYPGANQLIQDGATGLIASSQREFTHGIIRLLRSKKTRESMGANAKHMIQKHHSVTNIDTYVSRIFS